MTVGRTMVPEFSGILKVYTSLALLLLSWTSIMIPGFAFPWSNNVFHVPIVLGYASSVEGPHDAFTQSLANFVSGFWIALSVITHEENIFQVFFVTHLFGRVIFVVGVYGVIRDFCADKTVALALTGLASLAPILKGVTLVGHTEMLSSYLSHTGFAIAMLPGCWWLMLRRRWVASAALLGLVFNVNAFLSLWSIIAALSAFAVSRKEIDNLKLTLLLCGAAYLAFASPTFIWTLSTVSQPSEPINFRAYLLDYYPYHTFIHVQWEAAARYSIYLATAILVLISVGSKSNFRIPITLFAAYLCVFLIGLPLPYFTDSRLALNLYPLRIDAVINVALVAFALAWAGQSIAERKNDTLPLAISLSLISGNIIATLLLLRLYSNEKGQQRFTKFITATLAGSFILIISMGLMPSASEGFVPLDLLIGALALGTINNRSHIPLVGAAFVCMFLPENAYPWPVLGLALAVMISIWKSEWGSLAALASVCISCIWVLNNGDKVALAATVATILLSILLMTAKSISFERLRTLAIGPSGLLAGVLTIGLLLTGYAVWRQSIDRPDAHLAPLLEAQSWARKNIPPDTPYLPVGLTGFSVLSRRPAWVDAQAGAAVMWKPDFLAEWRPRMRELNACAETKCYADLARRHNLHWIVSVPGRVKNPARAKLRLQFANDKIEIYNLAYPKAPAGNISQ